jgi:hypothetical protein
VFAFTLLAIVILVGVGLFQRQSGPDLAGSWKLASVDGVKAPQNSNAGDEGFVIRENGTFNWPSFHIDGKWTIVEPNLVLHTEKYDGKSQAQFRTETEAKYPSDPAIQKVADKVFEDLKLSMSADGSTLSISFGGISQTYMKRATK